MNRLFQPYLRKYIIIFFDDILIYNRTVSDHLIHLETTFQVLMNGKFTLKLPKCSFVQQKIEYLGHIVSEKSVQNHIAEPITYAIYWLHNFAFSND